MTICFRWLGRSPITWSLSIKFCRNSWGPYQLCTSFCQDKGQHSSLSWSPSPCPALTAVLEEALTPTLVFVLDPSLSSLRAQPRELCFQFLPGIRHGSKYRKRCMSEFSVYLRGAELKKPLALQNTSVLVSLCVSHLLDCRIIDWMCSLDRNGLHSFAFSRLGCPYSSVSIRCMACLCNWCLFFMLIKIPKKGVLAVSTGALSSKHFCDFCAGTRCL